MQRVTAAEAQAVTSTCNSGRLAHVQAEKPTLCPVQLSETLGGIVGPPTRKAPFPGPLSWAILGSNTWALRGCAVLRGGDVF
jgi:hypothetical protein